MAKKYFVFFTLILLVLRFLHFGPELEAPHDWRQCDTAHYCRDFYENGLDLLHPKVCWMGNRDTLALEFPLPEAIVALGYRFTGESILLARLFFFLFFGLSVFYLYQFTGLLWGTGMARISSLIFMGAPLSLFYSRAIHIDFFVVFCTHAMVYYFLSGLKNKRTITLILSSVFAALAFLVKPAYPFYWAIPLLYYVHYLRQWRWFLSRSIIFMLPLVLFFWWQHHVFTINNASPDWSYILHYHKMIQSPGWYFGHFKYRFQLYPWYILFLRSAGEVAGFAGGVLLIFGLIRSKNIPQAGFLWSWLTGTGLYILVFFNLNVVHNYYQIPLVAPAAVLIGWGILSAAQNNQIKILSMSSAVVLVNFIYAEINYYGISHDHVEAGRIIQENTPEQALVIVTYGNLDCRNPQILYRAHRKGWSVEEAALNPTVLTRLRQEEKAAYWIYIGQDVPQSTFYALPGSLIVVKSIPLKSVKKTAFIFKLV